MSCHANALGFDLDLRPPNRLKKGPGLIRMIRMAALVSSDYSFRELSYKPNERVLNNAGLRLRTACFRSFDWPPNKKTAGAFVVSNLFLALKRL